MLTLSLPRLIVAGLDVLLSFDVTDNLFSKLEQVDVSPGSIDIDARTSCHNKSNPKNKVQNSHHFNSCIFRIVGSLIIKVYPKIETCAIISIPITYLIV